MAHQVETACLSLWTRSLPLLFLATASLQVALFEWARRWLVSGAPVLTICLLQGEASGSRILPFAQVWSLSATVNLAYALASTSWLLYWGFAALCYPVIFFTCLFQWQLVADATRKVMRLLLKKLHFVDDKIGIFDIPALEIDTEVDGLMVIRGITFSLTTLSFVVHGVDVGIKLSDDLQLAIRTERVDVSLFRHIRVGDCFANLKGGTHEMKFADMATRTYDDDGDALMFIGSINSPDAASSQSDMVKMRYAMTHGSPPKDSSHQGVADDIKHYSLEEPAARDKYYRMLDHIDATSLIRQARRHVEPAEHSGGNSSEASVAAVHLSDEKAIRAAVCSQLHPKPSIPNPPRRSIKVTTLQNFFSANVRRFLHRLPMLLRLLLNHLSHFHPVTISSVTATAPGNWIESLVVQGIFKGYDLTDSDLQSLKRRISAWIVDAQFAVELGSITGSAQVPLNAGYDINCHVAVENVTAYRALPQHLSLNEIAAFSGARSTFVVPSFLLPHHEHLLPPAPGRGPETEGELRQSTTLSEEGEVETSCEKSQKDEVAVKMSIHASLPAVFDKELLDFVASLAKASKIVEIDGMADEVQDEGRKLKDLPGALNQKVKDSLKKTFFANDQWIAKLVGKVMTRLGAVHGDVGYSGNIAVKLKPYRETGWMDLEGEKLAP